MKTPTNSKLDNLLRAELDRMVTINECGKAKRMKTGDLVPRAQINLAIKGNPLAQQHVMKMMRELEERDIQRHAALAEEAKAQREQQILIYEFMVRKKEERQRIWSEAEALNKEPDQPWPHPEDIMLFPKSQHWRIRGPWDETNINFHNWLRAERDHLFAASMQMRSQNGMRSREWHNPYTLLWVSYDVLLPLRWQLSQSMEVAFFNLAILTPRQLQAEINERKEQAKFMKALADITDEWDKDSYRQVNSIMKSLLNRQGYRSLAEFEHAFETQGEDMPWPKSENGASVRFD